jgi:hypothetical protein
MCFDAFLEQFPLCFGYWKKYADLELKKAGAAGAKAMYGIHWLSAALVYSNLCSLDACMADETVMRLVRHDHLVFNTVYSLSAFFILSFAPMCSGHDCGSVWSLEFSPHAIYLAAG